MNTLPQCSKCNSEYTYRDGAHFICPECAYEWTSDLKEEVAGDTKTIKDAFGNTLQDGDTITVIKVGTKVKNIRLVEGDHDIDCKIDGIGAMKLKSQFVKKV